MSIIGQPQEYTTVKSSLEVLDSPIWLRTETSGYSSEPLSNNVHISPPASSISMVRKPECSVVSIEVNTKSLKTVTDGLTVDRNVNVSSPTVKSDTGYSEQPEDERGKGNTKGDQSDTPSGAVYISTQKRSGEDIAVAIASEFEEHVKRSQRKPRREDTLEEQESTPELPTGIVQEENEYSPLTALETELKEYTENLYNSEEQSDLSNHTPSDILQPSDDHGTDSRHSDVELASNVSENSKMSTVQYESSRAGHARYGVTPQNISGRDQYSHLDPIRVPKRRDRITTNGLIYGQNRQYSSREDHHHHSYPDDNSRASQNHYTETRSPQARVSSKTPGNEITTTISQPRSREEARKYQDEAQSRTPGRATDVATHRSSGQRTVTRESGVKEIARSLPDGVDNPQVPAINEAEEIEIPRQNIPFPTHGGSMVSLQSVPPPNYNQPPTIIQNGVPKEELLELINKGLSDFTAEMALMVIEKLKPEYDTLAKQVGEAVKEATVSELKELREKLATAETELQALQKERDELKEGNSKERDLMKKEFEKDRLKRVKEFEEKKVLIDNLQKEIEQFKGMMKEKDKMFKKAEIKAKTEEQKRIKSEEESEKKVKEMQKELDKAKGELLVQKSKKRVQLSSAKEKKESLAKLNSHHGVGPRKFNGHKPIETEQYDEGDAE